MKPSLAWGKGLGSLVCLLWLLVGCDNPLGGVQSTTGPTLAVTPGVGRTTVSWKAVSGAESYQLESSATADFATSTSVVAATSPFDHSPVDPSRTVYYRVRAVFHSGVTSWSTASATTTAWTWNRDPVPLGTVTYSDTRTEVLAGVSVSFVTTYQKRVVRLESLRFDADGLTWSTWLRTTTTVEGLAGSTVVETTPAIRRGSWGTLWASFTVNSGAESHTVVASADRTSLTLDGDATSRWTLVP